MTQYLWSSSDTFSLVMLWHNLFGPVVTLSLCSVSDTISLVQQWHCLSGRVVPGVTKSSSAYIFGVEEPESEGEGIKRTEKCNSRLSRHKMSRSWRLESVLKRKAKLIKKASTGNNSVTMKMEKVRSPKRSAVYFLQPSGYYMYHKILAFESSKFSPPSVFLYPLWGSKQSSDYFPTRH
jgi:predicted metalloprotease